MVRARVRVGVALEYPATASDEEHVARERRRRPAAAAAAAAAAATAAAAAAQDIAHVPGRVARRVQAANGQRGTDQQGVAVVDSMGHAWLGVG